MARWRISPRSPPGRPVPTGSSTPPSPRVAHHRLRHRPGGRRGHSHPRRGSGRHRSSAGRDVWDRADERLGPHRDRGGSRQLGSTGGGRTNRARAGRARGASSRSRSTSPWTDVAMALSLAGRQSGGRPATVVEMPSMDFAVPLPHCGRVPRWSPTAPEARPRPICRRAHGYAGHRGRVRSSASPSQRGRCGRTEDDSLTLTASAAHRGLASPPDSSRLRRR